MFEGFAVKLDGGGGYFDGDLLRIKVGQHEPEETTRTGQGIMQQ